MEFEGGWPFESTNRKLSTGSRSQNSSSPPTDRHTHASLLIDLDAHPEAISERMGHSEIGVTMNVYGHLFQDKQEQLTNDLDALVERTRQPGRPDPSTVAITRSK